MAEKAAQQLLRRHPLQRLQSPSRGASALLHVSETPVFHVNMRMWTLTISCCQQGLWSAFFCLLLRVPRAQSQPSVCYSFNVNRRSLPFMACTRAAYKLITSTETTPMAGTCNT